MGYMSNLLPGGRLHSVSVHLKGGTQCLHQPMSLPGAHWWDTASPMDIQNVEEEA